MTFYSYNLYKHAYHLCNLCLYYPLDTYTKMAEKVVDRFPESYFTNLMIEKANIIKDHLHESAHSLIIVANIGPTMAVFKIYDMTKEDDSLKLCMTLSNLGDLHDQIRVLWQHVNFLLQEYCSHCTSG